MPNKNNHLLNAKDNEEFSDFLISEGRFIEWAATGFFYSAIHYIEAYMATQGIHSGSHRVRDSSVQSDPKLSAIYDDYNELKNDSIQSRYHGHKFPLEEINQDIRPSIEKVRACVLSAIP